MGSVVAFPAAAHSPYVTAMVSFGFFNIVPGAHDCCSVTEQVCCDDDAHHHAGAYLGGSPLPCCMDKELTLSLPRSRRRAIIGTADLWFAMDMDGSGPTLNDSKLGAVRQLQLASGYDCGPNATECLGSDGSGYILAPGAGHVLSDTLRSNASWGLGATLDWLAATARRPRSRVQ